MFNTSLYRRSSNQNYSLHMQRIFTLNWLNSYWIAVTCSILPFLSQDKQSDECTWKWRSLPSRNLYKCKQVDLTLTTTICFNCYYSLHHSFRLLSQSQHGLEYNKALHLEIHLGCKMHRLVFITLLIELLRIPVKSSIF